jgi:2-oxoacid:acceptor oxidoreductase gamma subunit (pyruvate/2-ketoisovalerate family)
MPDRHVSIMIKLRIHGRGGLGAVTASYILASAVFNEGLQSHAFVMYGIERRGSPVEAFCRISRTEIKDYSHINNPDVLLVLDPTLLKSNVESGLVKGGLVIINSKKKPGEIKLKCKSCHVKTVDLNSIASNVFSGKAFVNVPMVAAFGAITGLLSLESIYAAIDKVFEGNVAKLNKEAAKATYDKLKGETFKIKV